MRRLRRSLSGADPQVCAGRPRPARTEGDQGVARRPGGLPHKIIRAILIVGVTVAALAQTASEKPSLDVRRVGARLACQCGCKDSVATCSMLECHFSKPAKERIAQMQAVGMSDDQIVQAFVRDYGAGIYLAPPNAWGWIIP